MIAGARMYRRHSMPFTGWLLYLLLLLPSTLTAQTFEAERLNAGEPVLSAQHFQQVNAPKSEGNNINGPSVIRIPDWIPHELRAAPDARYYLYFAHHSGDYIRLAWARDIEGPWQLYKTGAGVAIGERGVLDMGIERRISLGGDLAITSHIASPDVHIDHRARRIVMYFHGVTRRGSTRFKAQQTYVATSPTGLDFSAGIVPVPLSISYLRVFEYNGLLQGLSPNKYHRPRDSANPWAVGDGGADIENGVWERHNTRFLEIPLDQQPQEAGRRKPNPRPRHLALHRDGNLMHVFYTIKEHSPERILATSVDLRVPDWFKLAARTSPVEILRAEREWEGGMLAPTPSRKGAARKLENALRDPFVFMDEGVLYLFYAGGGEQGIGLARLTPQPAGE
jgi:hypothetical protein